MSQSEIARFVADLKSNQDLLGEIKGGSSGLDSVVDMANAKGYDVTVDEAKEYIRSEAQKDLSDEQLDAIAGGKGSSTSTVTVQTTVTATTEAQTAETTTTVVAEAEAVVCAT